jgi:hypothetical protein
VRNASNIEAYLYECGVKLWRLYLTIIWEANDHFNERGIMMNTENFVKLIEDVEEEINKFESELDEKLIEVTTNVSNSRNRYNKFAYDLGMECDEESPVRLRDKIINKLGLGTWDAVKKISDDDLKVFVEARIDSQHFMEWASKDSVDLSNRIKLMAHRRKKGLRAEDYDKAEFLEFSKKLWEEFGREQYKREIQNQNEAI